MLQTIRDRSQGLIVGVIVFLISLTFALWGIQSYIDAGGKVVVAEAAGEEILLDEFQEALQRFRRQAQSILGEQFDASAWDTEAVKQRALDELIDDRILDEVAADSRIVVSDMQVARQLQQIPSFQDENGFSRAVYEQRVPLLGLTPTGFENKLRLDMVRGQIRAGIVASEFVTPEEAKAIERLRTQTRDIGYAIIPGSQYSDEIDVSEAELTEHFEANADAYRTEEQIKLEYLAISAKDLEVQVTVTDEALLDYYDNNLEDYVVEEQRNANHILFQLPQSADEVEATATLARVTEARARAEQGESFEELAKELSDDVGSSAEGGETGFFPRGAMAPEFEQAAFALAVGEVSQPVRTKFGYHLIKLKDIKEGGQQSFEQVKEQVSSAYRQDAAQKLFFDQAEQFSNLVYEHPDSLEVAAEVLGLEVIQTELLTRNALALLFSEKLVQRAFETEVLLEGLNAEPVELDDGRVIAVRVVEHEPSRIPAMSDVREQVLADVREDKARAATRAAGEEMIKKLRDGGTVSDVVSAEGFGWETAEAANRESNEVNRAVLRAAFKTAVGDGNPVYTGVVIGKSDYAIIRVANLKQPAEDELTESDVSAVQQELVTPRANTSWREFLAALRDASDVEIFEENL